MAGAVGGGAVDVEDATRAPAEPADRGARGSGVERLDGDDMTQLSLSNVGVEFGATKLFSDVTFTIAARERWGIIGRNGTGKTTLFRLITGDMQPTRGVIARQPALREALLELR